MTKRVRSAKGQIVDFDLLKIKEQMAAAPPTTDVKARQNFVDKRLRRRVKKAEPLEKVVKEEMEVDQKMPAPDETPSESKLIDDVKKEDTTVQPKSTQKARPKKKS